MNFNFLGSCSLSGLVVEYIVATENTFNITCAVYLLNMVPRGLEPRTLRLLAVRSNQLSYETHCFPRSIKHNEHVTFQADV